MKIGNPITANKQANGTAGATNGSNGSPAGAVFTAPAKRPAAPPAPASYSSDSGASSAKRGSGSRAMPQIFVPISAVNQFQKGLAIKGRVTSKTPMKTWANERGTGNLFSFDIKDESGEIRVTAFKEQANRLMDMIQMGQVFIIFKAQVKPANKKFSTLPHEFELTIGDDTEVNAGDENDQSCPQLQFDFVRLHDIENAEKDSFVDVVAIVHRVSDVATIVQKSTQKELKKRDVTLVDDSQAEITLTLWAKEAEGFYAEPGTAIILKKGKVSDYNGKSLNASMGSSIQIDPDHPAAIRLKEWYEATKNDLQLVSLTNQNSRETPFKLLFQVLDESVTHETAVYAQVRATFVHMAKTTSYDACRTDNCKKRLTDMNNGSWRCLKCDKEFDSPLKRFVQSVQISDPTADLYVSVFHEELMHLLKMTSNTDITDEELQVAKVEELISLAGCRQFILKLKAVKETYNEVTRTKGVVLELKPVDYVVQARRLLSTFRALTCP